MLLTIKQLRAAINEALVNELKLDKWFMNRIGMHNHSDVGIPIKPSNVEARWVAIRWIDDAEYELGEPLDKSVEVQIKRYVADRWPMIEKKYPDNEARKEAMRDLLDNKFNPLFLAQKDKREAQ